MSNVPKVSSKGPENSRTGIPAEIVRTAKENGFTVSREAGTSYYRFKASLTSDILVDARLRTAQVIDRFNNLRTDGYSVESNDEKKMTVQIRNIFTSILRDSQYKGVVTIQFENNKITLKFLDPGEKATYVIPTSDLHKFYDASSIARELIAHRTK